jgi:AraC-like DNA-binding protein
MPASPDAPDIALSMTNFMVNQTIASPRYHWNCHDRGPAPFVILQWTQSGEGIFENRRGVQRDLFRRLQARFGPVLPLSSRGAAAATLRRLMAAASEPVAPERSSVSLLSYAFALEWWREAAAPTGGRENRLTRAVQVCRQRFREPLGVKEIANEVGMSREHFTRIFVEEMRQPPAAFLRQLRVDEASLLLRETELPLREIALRSGFYSARHLMRTFQRVHRIAPAAYRRRKAAARRQPTYLEGRAPARPGRARK